jgi:hypothetical protein
VSVNLGLVSQREAAEPGPPKSLDRFETTAPDPIEPESLSRSNGRRLVLIVVAALILIGLLLLAAR